MTAFVDVQLIEGLALPYEAGAEAALAAADLDPAFTMAWQGLLDTFPGLSLQPLFDGLPIEELADVLDAIRIRGEEPPNPFVWFTLPCDDAVADALVPAVQALSFVAFARRRTPAVLAGTISYGTNPDAIRTLQIQAAPTGVDAIYVWQVAGGTGDGIHMADIENGWLLSHEELLTARIRKASVFGSGGVDHGTGVAGILVGADNGVGTIGIVPDSALALVTELREGEVFSMANAVRAATKAVGAGGVVLIESGLPFFPGNSPDILAEFDPAVQVAIRIATGSGVTVVEPAGNGGVDLDKFPFLAHTRPESPTFSGAVVVGAGELAQPTMDSWDRTFSSFGSRVDCFAAGSQVRAPSSTAANAYQQFSGTSSASAIVAGVVASMQGMSVAATGAPLAPADIRRLVRNHLLGTLPNNEIGARIGTMPDLRKIARFQGWIRMLPVGATAVAGVAVAIVQIDPDDRLVRREWTPLTGWSQPLPLPAPSDTFHLTDGQPAVISTVELAPLPRIVQDAFFVGPGGVQHLAWDSLGATGDLTASIAPVSAVAQGRSLAAVRAGLDLVVVAGISPEGRLVVMTGDPDLLPSTQLSAPLAIDTVGMYRRVAGPAIVSRSPALADIVAIEDGGTLRWFTGTTIATIGTGWSAGLSDSSGVAFEPGARPALLVVGDGLLAAGVGSEGWLQALSIDPVAGTIEAPVVVDVQVTIATSGPVGLGRAGANVVALGVDTEGDLRAATRPFAGGDWTPLIAVVSTVAVSPLGGVTAVSLDGLGVMALVMGIDGIARFSLSADGLVWPALQPVS